MSRHYHHQINTPFINGSNLVNGKWKALDGQWHNFRELEQADIAFTKGSLKTSKHWAEVRWAKAANAFKWTGRICFGVSAGISAINIGNAYMTDDSNKKDVYIKNSLDVTMGIVAFIPGFGWAISGTYFIMDAEGAFGSWGQASGFSRTQVDNWIDRDRAINRQKFYEPDFDIEYKKPIEQQHREAHTIEQDNTRVRKKTLFKTFH